jgi:SAM-dependent methyltransferase
MILQFAEDSALTPATTFCCEICRTDQSVPETDAFRCNFCGQEYSAGDPTPSIVLSPTQLAALRNLSGRDATGKSTLVTNWWTKNRDTEKAGDGFLFWNKDMPSRQFTRQLIADWAAAGEIKTVLEIAFGGLHEYRALRSKLRELQVTYSGVDWTDHFVQHAQQEFPECRWTQGDIVRGVAVEPADVVYSQHMLEHIPSLEPALSNMLRLARRKFINIFFLPPKPFEGYDVVNWNKHPIYHNTYGIGHVEKVCQSQGFRCTWKRFPPVAAPNGGTVEDMVLLAEKD